MSQNNTSKMMIFAAGSRYHYKQDLMPEYRKLRTQNEAFCFYDAEKDKVFPYGYMLYSIKRNAVKEMKDAGFIQHFREMEAAYINTASLNRVQYLPYPTSGFGSEKPVGPRHGNIFMPTSNRNSFNEEINPVNFNPTVVGFGTPFNYTCQTAAEKNKEKFNLLMNGNDDDSGDTESNVIPLRKA